MSLKHKKISLIEDGADDTLIRPSDWNAEHQVDFVNALLKADAEGNLVAAVEGADYEKLGIPSVPPVVLTNTGPPSNCFKVSRADFVAAAAEDFTTTKRPVGAWWIVLYDLIIFIFPSAIATNEVVGLSFEDGESDVPVALGVEYTTGDTLESYASTVAHTYVDGNIVFNDGVSGSIYTSTGVNLLNSIIVGRGKSGGLSKFSVGVNDSGYFPPDNMWHTVCINIQSDVVQDIYTDSDQVVRSGSTGWATTRQYGVTKLYEAVNTGYLDFMTRFVYSVDGQVISNPDSEGLIKKDAAGNYSLIGVGSFATNDHNHDAEYEPIGAASAAVAAILDAAPETLDTLNELAAALGDDPNFAATMAAAIGGKQDTLVSGTNIKTINGVPVLGAGNITIPIAPNITVSTENPSGGSPGDIWIKYTP